MPVAHFPLFSVIWNREDEFLMLLYVSHTWSEYLMACINIFSTTSSGNLYQPLRENITSSGFWLFWLFSTGFSCRGWLFWIISLIGFTIHSSPLWLILFSGKSWRLLIPSWSQKNSVHYVLLFLFSVIYVLQCDQGVFIYYLFIYTLFTVDSI